MDQQNSRERAPLDWVTAKEFRSGDLVVAVRRAMVGRWSRWSMQVGMQREGQDRVGSFIGLFEDREWPGPEIRLQVDVAGELAGLVDKAQEWVCEQIGVEKASNAVTGQRSYVEERAPGRGGGGGAGGGAGGGRGGGRDRGRRGSRGDHDNYQD